MRVVFGALCVLCAAPSWAWPVDQVRDVDVGTPALIPLGGLDWFEVEDASVLTAQRMPAGELMLMGAKPGRSLLLLYGDGKMAVWQVRVASKPLADGALLEAAKKVCPKLKATPDEETQLVTPIADEKCRAALLSLFKTDSYVAGKMELVFELAALQSQLKALNEAFAGVTKAPLRTRYLGAGLELSGQLSVSEHKKVLWALFRASVGRVALNDQIELPEAVDAGEAAR
ncbi:MAG: hypothetical protein K1X64_01770 [Myxococcaceae bacterium]|nr:hypothetical protein [Myxococcaceae bacterium]